jgi:hypothetical protein
MFFFGCGLSLLYLLFFQDAAIKESLRVSGPQIRHLLAQRMNFKVGLVENQKRI